MTRGLGTKLVALGLLQPLLHHLPRKVAARSQCTGGAEQQVP